MLLELKFLLLEKRIPQDDMADLFLPDDGLFTITQLRDKILTNCIRPNGVKPFKENEATLLARYLIEERDSPKIELNMDNKSPKQHIYDRLNSLMKDYTIVDSETDTLEPIVK